MGDNMAGREDILAQLLLQLQGKEEAPQADENTEVQKLIAPNDSLQCGDTLTLTNVNPSIFVWGGKYFDIANFSRSTTAFLDGQLVSQNQPRYMQGKFGNSILVEEGTTNMIPSIRHSFVSGWTAYLGAIVTVTPNQPDPHGYNKAYRIQTTGGTSNTKYYTSVGASVNGVPYSTQVWVKVNSATNLRVMQNLYAASVIVTQSDGWKLVEIPNTVGNGIVNVQLLFNAINISDNLDFFACYPQIESKAYCTTYTETTRANEFLGFPTKNVLYSDTGTVDVWVNVNDLSKQLAFNQIFFVPRSSSIFSQGIILRHYNTNANWQISTGNDIGEVTSAYASDSFTPNGWHLFTVTWSITSCKLYIDGILRATINSPKLPNAFHDVAFIGHDGNYGGVQYINTDIDDIRISNVERNATEILEYYQSNTAFVADDYTTALLNFDSSVANSKSIPPYWVWNQGQYFGTLLNSQITTTESAQLNEIEPVFTKLIVSNQKWGGTGVNAGWLWSQGQYF